MTFNEEIDDLILKLTTSNSFCYSMGYYLNKVDFHFNYGSGKKLTETQEKIFKHVFFYSETFRQNADDFKKISKKDLEKLILEVYFNDLELYLKKHK